MRKKHCLPLTVEEKIKEVREGNITQTIRPVSENTPKLEGHWVMFHGWEGKPYRSSWSWRSPYWQIIKTFKIKFDTDLMYTRVIEDPYKTHRRDYPSVLKKTNEGEEFYRLSPDQAHKLAIEDGIVDYWTLFEDLRDMYGKPIYNMTFKPIIWNPDIVLDDGGDIDGI